MDTTFDTWKTQFWAPSITTHQRIAALCVLVAMTPPFIKVANFFVAAAINQPEMADTFITSLKTRLFVYWGELPGKYYYCLDNTVTEGPATDPTTFLASDIEEATTIASLYNF